MEKLIEFLREISPRRLMIVGGSFAFIVISIITSAVLLTGPRYSVLYGNLDAEDSADIVRVLEGLGETYKIGQQNGSVLVPVERVSRLRIALAEEGLPSGGSTTGYEIFDKDQGFGTSNFVQELNHLRALEGELAKTISSISGIKSARVHLVLPKRELFSRDKRKPRASIIIGLTGRRELEPSQIRAIRSLVSSAVPDLSSSDISIVDSHGKLLARGNTEEGDNQLSGSTPDEIRAAYERRLSEDLISLIESVVGYGNVRVEVRALMDFSKTVVQEEVFDPDGQVLRSSEEVSQDTERTDVVNQGITVANNLPGNEAAEGEGARNTQRSTSNQLRNNYEISKQTINRVTQPGHIERLSVAVLIDGVYTRGEDNDIIYSPREENDLIQIERLVKTAIGFDGNGRQDSVDVVNLRFASEELDVFAEQDSILGFKVGNLQDVIELIILSVVALVVFLVVLRPLLIRALTKEAKRNVRMRLDGVMVDGSTGEPVGSAGTSAGGGGGIAGSAGSLLGIPNEEDGLANLSGMDAQVRQTLNQQLNDVVAQHPVETGNVIKNWLLEG